MLQIIQKTYEGAPFSTPASGVIALFALNGGTIKTVRVKVDAANTSGATRFNLSKNSSDLFTTELTVAQNQTVISLTGLNIAVSRFDRLVLNLETVSAGGVVAPIALQVESDELVLVSQADIYDAVKAIILAGTNITRTADDAAKTLTFASSGGGSSPAQSSITVTTTSIADNATDDTTGALGKYSLLSRIVADRACRVRIYQTAAYQTADAARAIGVDPTGEHGVLLDAVIEASNLTLDLSPIAALCDGESPRTGDLNISITNMSGSTHTVAVTFTILILEA